MNAHDLTLAERLRRDEIAERARRGGLLSFTLHTFPEYEVNWHHKLTCAYLNKFIRGEIRRLMIFEPPRHGKSELTSRRLPALLHGLYPNDEILAASYNSDYASDLTVDVQRIMDRPDYQELFPYSRITPDGTLSKYKRTRNEHELIPIQHPDRSWFFPKGSYKSAGIGGSFTGRGGKWVLIDDPYKNQEDADSRAYRETAWKTYTSSIRTRLEKDASILITLTRWHADDMAGRLLRMMVSDPDADQFVVLKLPAIRETDADPYDPRAIGEALWPTKYTVQELASTKAALGSRQWSALYQQSPTAEGGNIIKSAWIKYWTVLPQKFDQIIQSWDFAVKDKTTSDYTVGQVWGRIGANKWVLDQVRGRWDFPSSCHQLIMLSKKWPAAGKKVVEAKANGPAVIQTLKNQVPGLVEAEPYGDKVMRLNAVAPDYEAGNVYYPDPQNHPWVNDHVLELCEFPNGTNDDQVDAASQALDVLRRATPFARPITGHGSGVIFK